MTEYELIRRQLAARLSPPQGGRLEPERIPQAAVTLILRDQAGAAEALIIKRAERPGDHWSGHLALPGGRAEQAKDTDLLATAARETYEEVGLDLHQGGEFIGQLPLLAPSTPSLPPLEITPFVALAPPELALRPNHEVAAVFWLPVAHLKLAGLSSEYRLQFGSVVKKWPAYPSAGGPIWGLTERILTNFLSLLD